MIRSRIRQAEKALNISPATLDPGRFADALKILTLCLPGATPGEIRETAREWASEPGEISLVALLASADEQLKAGAT